MNFLKSVVGFLAVLLLITMPFAICFVIAIGMVGAITAWQGEYSEGLLFMLASIVGVWFCMMITKGLSFICNNI